jgi:hypothetical protein
MDVFGTARQHQGHQNERKWAKNELQRKIQKLIQATEMTETTTKSCDFLFSVAPMMDSRN